MATVSVKYKCGDQVRICPLGVVVSVSEGLIMRREQVQESSLLVPSGAYLTWMAMIDS